MLDDKSDGALSPVDIIAQARGALGSEQPAAGQPAKGQPAAKGPAKGELAKGEPEDSSSRAPRTREEHLKRATGSFAIVEGAGPARGKDGLRAGGAKAGKPSRTNNPRVLKAEAEAAGTGVGTGANAAESAGAGVGAGAAAGAGAAKEGPKSEVSVEAADTAKPTGTASSGDAKPGSAEGFAAAKPARPSVAKSARVARPAKGGEAEKPGEPAGAAKPGRLGAQPRRAEAVPRNSRRVALAACAVAVVVALAGAIGGFSFFRWVGADDAADVQGTWYIAGTDTPITITEEGIVLNDEVTYRYVLNPEDKTIAFTFSYLEGAGHYRFSLDRQQLAIMDGAYGWWDTLVDDFGWTLGALVASAQGAPASPAGEGDVTLLTRTSAAEAAAAQAAAEAAANPEAPEGDLAAAAEAAAGASDAPVPDAIDTDAADADTADADAPAPDTDAAGALASDSPAAE